MVSVWPTPTRLRERRTAVVSALVRRHSLMRNCSRSALPTQLTEKRSYQTPYWRSICRRTSCLRGQRERNDEKNPLRPLRGSTPGSSAAPEEGPRLEHPAESRLDTLHETAREMRRNPTEAQVLLAEGLVAAELGKFRFRRQVVIGSAIVDISPAIRSSSRSRSTSPMPMPSSTVAAIAAWPKWASRCCAIPRRRCARMSPPWLRRSWLR